MKTTLTLEDVERLEELSTQWKDGEFLERLALREHSDWVFCILPLILPVIREHVEGSPKDLRPPQGACPPAGTDVSPDERLLSEAHDAMLTAEDALSEFCGHNDETRGGWALQALSRSIANINSHQCITGGTSAHPGSHPVGSGSKAQASQKTAQKGSVCEVEPLGEIDSMGSVHFKDEDGDRVEFWISGADDGFGMTCSEIQVFFPKDKIPSLIAHLTAWLATGSFDLKGLPSSPPSSEDTELLDWLETQSKASRTGISFDYVRYVEDGQVLEKGYRFMRRHFLGERKDTLRAAIRAARAKEAQASTTSQKGGQGV